MFPGPRCLVAFLGSTLTFRLTTAQLLPLSPQNDTFNSSYALTQQQISLANLTATDAANIAVALNFERSNWATGSVLSDPFYTQLPSNASHAGPGSLIKLQAFVNTTSYTVPPTLALSRFIFQSANLNNTPVPSSAFILWPYTPRNFSDLNGSTPLVIWAHGASGMYPECAPSHIRNLWYSFSGPFNLALEGYAVVGIDYTGLGVPHNANNGSIPYQSNALPAQANDLFYAAEAAQSAFPSQLSKSFAIVGHSVGGGAAWAAAERQSHTPVPGYLGAVAASPVTNATAIAVALQVEAFSGIALADSIASVFPHFNTSILATMAGQNYLTLARELNMCNSAFLELLTSALTASPAPIALSPPTWPLDPTVQAWQELALAGGKNASGPLLILQGTMDTTAPKAVTDEYVQQTCNRFADDVRLEYATFEGVGHVPVMYAAQPMWMDWMEGLFSGRQVVGKGCKRTTYGAKTPRPLVEYQAELDYFLEWATGAYETA